MVIGGLCVGIVGMLSLMIGNRVVSGGRVIQGLLNFDSEKDLDDVVSGGGGWRTMIGLLSGGGVGV